MDSQPHFQVSTTTTTSSSSSATMSSTSMNPTAVDNINETVHNSKDPQKPNGTNKQNECVISSQMIQSKVMSSQQISSTNFTNEVVSSSLPSLSQTSSHTHGIFLSLSLFSLFQFLDIRLYCYFIVLFLTYSI
jgi:hypothetical protein